MRRFFGSFALFVFLATVIATMLGAKDQITVNHIVAGGKQITQVFTVGEEVIVKFGKFYVEGTIQALLKGMVSVAISGGATTYVNKKFLRKRPKEDSPKGKK